MATAAKNLPLEVQFAQKLAANEKTTRDRALKRLRRWIRVRSASKNGFKNDDMLKLWKGLFYCMWMSDKPLVQEDLAASIAGLIHHFQSRNSALKFVENFLNTMGREWFGIDRFRLNKFEMLFRQGISAIFEYLKRKEWDFVLVKKVVGVLQTIVIRKHGTFKGFPLSLQLHLAEVYVEEFAKVSEDEVSDEVKMKVIEPYCKLIVVTKSEPLRNRIGDKVFKLIMKISNVGMDDKHKMDVESEPEIGPTSEDEEILETVEKEAEPEVAPPPEEEEIVETVENGAEPEVEPKRKRKKGKSKIKKHSYRTMFIKNERRDLNLPFLTFDYAAIAERLIKLASTKGVRDRNRATAYDLAKKFRSLASGVYPLVMNMPEYDGSDLEESDLEDALERYQENILKRHPDVRRKRFKTKQT